MALGILNILFLIITIFVLCSIIALYLNKGALARNNSIFSIIAIVDIIITIISFTSLPSNYITFKILFILCAVVSVISLIVKYTKKEMYDIARLLLLISLLGAFILLLI